jgi:hypothetical protein
MIGYQNDGAGITKVATLDAKHKSNTTYSYAYSEIDPEMALNVHNNTTILVNGIVYVSMVPPSLGQSSTVEVLRPTHAELRRARISGGA